MIFEIEGMQELTAKIKALPDRTKRLEVLKILRRQMKPIQSAIRNATPEADAPIKFRGKIYPIGNAKKSISIFTGRNKEYPQVYVGPTTGKKRKYDAWYLYLLVYGWRDNRSTKDLDYIRKTANPLLPNVTKVMTSDLKKYIDKRIQQL